jgi:predicted membrane protein
MLLILIGTLNLTHRGKSTFGLILITIGIFFLLPDIFNFTMDIHKLFWSLVFLIIGVVILFHNRRDHEHWHRKFRSDWHSHWHDKWKWEWDKESDTEQKTETSPTDFIDEVNVFSGGDRKIVSKSFRGGKITSMFGGSTYDLLDCELAEGKNVLEVVNIFGGSKLLVPSDWKVHLDVVAMFGGFADKRRRVSQTSDPTEKILFITGIAIFGGGETIIGDDSSCFIKHQEPRALYLVLVIVNSLLGMFKLFLFSARLRFSYHVQFYLQYLVCCFSHWLMVHCKIQQSREAQHSKPFFLSFV